MHGKIKVPVSYPLSVKKVLTRAPKNPNQQFLYEMMYVIFLRYILYKFEFSLIYQYFQPATGALFFFNVYCVLESQLAWISIFTAYDL